MKLTVIKICSYINYAIVKVLHKLARYGVIKEFIGISDPFEKNSHGDLVIDGEEKIEDILSKIINYLKHKSIIKLL